MKKLAAARRGALRDASRLTLVLIIAAIGCVPIIGQPVQVDDPLFLAMAKQILQTPLSPFAGTPAWYDRDWFSENANPPLWGYLLAATAKVFGWNESAFQILQCLANVALTFGVFMLAKRVCLRPVFWTAAVMLSPFLLPGRNLMADTLMLACWVWSFEFLLRDALDGKRGRGVYLGLLAAAAMMTKYTGGLLAPIFLLLGWRWGRQRIWSWLIPSLVFAAWCGHNLHFYGRMHFFASASGGNIEIVDRVRVFARVVGAMVLWGPVWIVAGWRSAIGWRKAVLALSLPAAALAAGGDFWDAIVRLQLANVIIEGPVVAHFAGFMASGILAFAAFIATFRDHSSDPNDRARSALVVWLVAAATFNLFATSSIAFGAVRHLVVAIIPFVLLGGGSFDRMTVNRTGVVVFAWLTLFVSAAVGGLIAHGDRLEAAAGVVAVKEAAAFEKSGQRTWVAGDSALRYLAERRGVAWAKTDLSDVPVGGGVAIAYLRAIGYRQHPFFTSQARLVKRVVLESWNPVRAQETQVSFYGANLMTLPWMADFRRQAAGPMGGQPYDTILVYQRMK